MRKLDQERERECRQDLLACVAAADEALPNFKFLKKVEAFLAFFLQKWYEQHWASALCIHEARAYGCYESGI